MMCESTICQKCNKFVFDENAIYCNVCCSWFHLYCTKLNLKTLKIYGSDNLPWYCDLCLKSPFDSTSDKAINDMAFNSCQIDVCLGTCIYCNKYIQTKDKILKCKLSKHYVHFSCEKSVSRNKVSDKHLWSCSNCYVFPFEALDLDDFLEATSYYNAAYVQKCDVQKLIIPKVFASSINEFLNDDENELTDFCKYYTLDTFNEMQRDNRNCLSIFHTNIRSLKRNFENLNQFLDSVESQFDIIALSETWSIRKKSKNNFSLSGYHSLEELPGSTQNSGCGVYIKENLNFKKRNDLTYVSKTKDEEFQALWVEILNKKKKNILLCVVYRHPKSKRNELFSNYLKEKTQTVLHEKKELIIVGDFNMNFLQYDKDQTINEFIDITLQNCLKPYILLPTFFKPNQKPSLIDNILYSGVSDDCISGNFECPISDHLPNFILIKKVIMDKRVLKTKYRDMKNFDENLFLQEFQSKNILNSIKATKSTNEKTEILFQFLEELLEKHAPTKTLTNKQMRQKEKTLDYSRNFGLDN